MRKTNAKNGFVMLAVLLAIVIIALLYMIDLTAMFGPTEKGSIYKERPWFEEKRLLDEKFFPIEQPGKKGQVVIKDKTVFAGSVQRKDENRGDIEIIIDPNGKAYGRWSCAYEYPDSNYVISAEFAGNIDPTKIYQDEKGKNKRLLYFITKGLCHQIKTEKLTNNQWPGEQTIYVVGWIQKDFSAKGKLFLMAGNDEETHGNAEYDWQTNTVDLKNADKSN